MKNQHNNTLPDGGASVPASLVNQSGGESVPASLVNQSGGARVPASRSPFPQWMVDEVSAYDLELVHPPLVILDIGANIGAFSARMVEKYPGSVIHAYEPVVENFNQLLSNLQGKLQVMLSGCAVRGFSGTDNIYLGDRGVTCGFHQLGRQTATSRPVQCFDAAYLPKSDFVKIDTEGCEVEILSRLDLKPVTALVVEYHRAEDRLTILTVGETAGFELVQEIPGDATGQWGCLKFARPGSYVVGQSCRSASGGASVPASLRKLFIAIPLFGGTPALTVHAIAQLVANPPLNARIVFDASDASIGMARDAMTAKFLASDCDQLLFCDSDLVPSPEDFARIASHNQPVVGGMYPIKSEGALKWCGNGFPVGREKSQLALPARAGLPVGEQPIGEDGLQRVRYLGTGFLCIERSVIERIIAADRAEIEYTSDEPPHETRYNFWRMGVRATDDARRRYLTEDWFFCQRCLELGIPVYADTKVRLRHIGQATWPLQSQLLTSDLRPLTSA